MQNFLIKLKICNFDLPHPFPRPLCTTNEKFALCFIPKTFVMHYKKDLQIFKFCTLPQLLAYFIFIFQHNVSYFINLWYTLLEFLNFFKKIDTFCSVHMLSHTLSSFGTLPHTFFQFITNLCNQLVIL